MRREQLVSSSFAFDLPTLRQRLRRLTRQNMFEVDAGMTPMNDLRSLLRNFVDDIIMKKAGELR
jgi:hypothetical protein